MTIYCPVCSATEGRPVELRWGTRASQWAVAHEGKLIKVQAKCESCGALIWVTQHATYDEGTRSYTIL